MSAAYDLARLSPDEQSELHGLLLAKMDARYRDDANEWLREQVWTIDEASKAERRWPTDKAYLDEFIEILCDPDVTKLAVPKSRRMMVTWAVAAFGLWTIRYSPAAAVFWQSEVEEKAAFVLEKRMAWIEDHLVDAELRRTYKPIRTTSGLIGRLTFDRTGSYAWAVAQGGDVGRTYTPTVWVMDEIEFMKDGHKAVTAAIPFAEKGAKLILVSSSNGPRGVLADLCREIGFTRFS